MQPTRRFMAHFLLAATILVPVVSAGSRLGFAMRRSRATIIGGTPEKTAPTAAVGTNATNDIATGRNSNERQPGDYWKWRHDHPDRD